jgi:glutathione S-transferase
MLTIFGYAASINVRKVLWVCEELGLAFAREDWGGGTRPTSDPRFLSLNPVGMVPVIDDDGVVVFESNAIVRYLAASRRRTDLLPDIPAERARVEQWMDWQGSDFNNAWRAAYQGLVKKNPAFQDPAAIEASARQLGAAVGVVDGQLGRTGAYVAGERFTVADVVIGLSLHRWRSIPIERTAHRNVERYLERLRERAGFRRYGVEGGP